MPRLAFWTSFIATICLCAISKSEVDFPGPKAGVAKAVVHGSSFTLQNSLISETWRVSQGTLRPERIVNKLAKQSFGQIRKEIFRVGLSPTQEEKGLYVGVRLTPTKVIVSDSKDAKVWTELASYSRSDFPGMPKLMRLGKMNLKAETKDNAGDLGSPGSSTISDVSLAPNHSYKFSTKANQAETTDLPIDSNASFFSCRIEKQTDKGLSWGPAMALVWDDGKRFLLVGARDADKTLNVTTQSGERIIEANLPIPISVDLPSSKFHLQGKPRVLKLHGDSRGTRVAEKIQGQAIVADLVSDTGLIAHWRAELRDGSSYIRQTVQFSSPIKTIPIFGVQMIDLHYADLKTIGAAPGCPVAGDGLFAGVEMPGAQNDVSLNETKIGFACRLELSPKQSYSFSSVIGVAPEGQLRRAFLYYIERERARPSSPFLHYNSWYDLGYTVTADKIVDAATAFHKELVEKRGVVLKSYLVDDGWDDPAKGLWTENQTIFPGGFPALKARMDQLNAHLGVWISPLGGYGGAEERTADAQKMGLIPKGSGLDLSYPAYKEWFEKRCLTLMREGGVNAFKWDRAGDGVSPHFMALLDIAKTLRKQNKDVFINVTVGTWPSPFWLNHIDSTWRMGSADVGWAGKGDKREQWLTYRDGYCKKLFVDKSPLYPLNSVMHHGIVNGRFFQGEPIGKTGPHLKNEARSYFANGTSLQELYLTPSFMTSEAWNEVADAAKWAKANADVLADSHWIGGDPLQLQVYGYASWNKRKGTLMLRNPDDRPKMITLDIDSVFELPKGALQQYNLKSPYADQRIQKLSMAPKHPVQITLQPFEVLVFDAYGR